MPVGLASPWPEKKGGEKNKKNSEEEKKEIEVSEHNLHHFIGVIQTRSDVHSRRHTKSVKDEV